MTFDINTTKSDILTFVLRMNGAGSDPYHCPGPDRGMEAIYIHSSCSGGTTWSLMAIIGPSAMDSSKLIRLPLMPNDKGPSCRMKIWQPYHSGAGKDVWALDDFYVGPKLTAGVLSFNSSMPNASAFVGDQLVEDFCNRTRVIVLLRNADDHVFLETQPVRIGFGFMIQLELVFECRMLDSASSYDISVEYSTGDASGWKTLNQNRKEWVHHVTEFRNWRRISLKLPPESWSDSTRFRIVRKEYFPPGSNTKAAVGFFYAGPECPELCRLNGRCSLSGCVCDAGFFGDNCLPEGKILLSESNTFSTLTGGRLTSVDEDGCFVRGIWNAVMDSTGVRMVESKEVGYLHGTSIQFFLRLGECNANESIDKLTIRMEISWDGGSEWILIQEYQNPFFPTPQFQRVAVPHPEEGTSSSFFKIRLIQSKIQQRDRNIWSLGGFTVWNPSMALTGSSIQQLDRNSIETNEDLWIVTNGADPQTSCSLFDIYCRNRIQWYGAMTKDLILEQGYSIQFGIVAPSSGSDSMDWIRLEYSADGGVNWNWVQVECIHSWENCREITQSSRMDYAVLTGSEERFHYFVTEEMANR